VVPQSTDRARPAPRPAPRPAQPPPAPSVVEPTPVEPKHPKQLRAAKPKQPKKAKAAKPKIAKPRRERVSRRLAALFRKSGRAAPAGAPPLDGSEPLPRSRAQRLRAERTAHRVRLRRVLEIVGAVLAIVVIVSLALAFSGGGTSIRSKTVAEPTAHASVTGANLRNPLLATTFLGSASSDIAAVTTYDYRHLDDALTAGLAVTTGEYRRQYQFALTGDLARTAAAEHVVHTFEVLDVGIGAMAPDGSQAKVLIFGQERIVDDTTGPDGDVSPLTLCATIKRLGNLYLISELTQNTDPGLPPGGPDLATAVAAAHTEVVDMLSFRRAEFPADLQRALDGATTPLRDQLESGADDARAALENGKYDTSGTVDATAVVRADADTVSLLVVAKESRTADGTSEPTVLTHRYEVTVIRTASGWAASQVASVDGAD
jgi:hypothetical protein